MSSEGASVAFVDTLNTFGGWKAMLATANAWIQYNGVDFGSKKLSTVDVRLASETGGTVQVRLDHVDGPIIAEIRIPSGTEWKIISSPLSKYHPGIRNLIVLLKGNASVEIDWISFE
jgi:hypothetical protein